MRRMTLIRMGLASVLVGGVIAAGAFATGCGGDDNGTKPSSGDDSGMDATSIPPGDDGSTPGDDSSTVVNKDGGGGGDADAGPTVVQGKVILVHGSAGAPLRFCYGAVTSDAGTIKMLPVNPSPNTALGVPPGTGGPGAESSTDLANRSLEVFAINAQKIASVVPSDAGTELKCDALLGTDALTPNGTDAGGLGLMANVDYWDIGNLPAGTLANGTTTLIVVNGCVPGITDTNDQVVDCPAGYSPTTGDLGMWTAKLDTTTPLDGGSIGAQFAYASNPFSYESAAAGGVAAVAGFYISTLVTPETPDAGDAGDAAVEAAAPIVVQVPHLVAGGVTNGHLAPTTLVPVSGVAFDGTSGFFANAVTSDGGATPFQLPIPLPLIQQISAPSVPLDAGYFSNGAGYVFVLVGDPNPAVPTFLDDAGTFNVQKAHLIAFPTNPPFGAN